MKIILDAYQFSNAVTGTDRMAHNFLRELQVLDTTNSYIVIASQHRYIHSVIQAPNFRLIRPSRLFTVPYFERYLLRVWRTVTYWRIKFLGAAVFYSFHNMRLPAHRVAKKQIASNLDLIPMVLDGYADIGRGGREHIVREYQRVVHQADAFVSISQYSADELHNQLNVPRKKITVVPLAADELFSKTTSSELQVPKQFIFTIGGSEPRKNVVAVVEAHLQLPEKLQKAYPLYIAGGSWHGNDVALLKKSDYIHVLGYVSDEQLAELYTRTTLFVFASQYEGFGFTILEAMSAGAPVLCARSSSLIEVAGDATEMFEPTSSTELTKKLRAILENKALRDTLSKKGKQQAKMFSWKKSTQKLLGIFGQGPL